MRTRSEVLRPRLFRTFVLRRETPAVAPDVISSVMAIREGLVRLCLPADAVRHHRETGRANEVHGRPGSDECNQIDSDRVYGDATSEAIGLNITLNALKCHRSKPQRQQFGRHRSEQESKSIDRPG